MKQIYFLVLVLLSTFVLAEAKETQGQLDEAILLHVANTAVVSELRITLMGVNDDGHRHG